MELGGVTISEISAVCMQQTMDIYPKGRLRPNFPSSIYYLFYCSYLENIIKLPNRNEYLLDHFKWFLWHTILVLFVKKSVQIEVAVDQDESIAVEQKLIQRHQLEAIESMMGPRVYTSFEQHQWVVIDTILVNKQNSVENMNDNENLQMHI